MWNDTPDAVQECGFLDAIEGVIMSSGRGTCFTKTSDNGGVWHELDYFVVSSCLRDAFDSAAVDLDSGSSPHLPVLMRARCNPRCIDTQRLKTPKPFPKSVPIGPMRKPRAWPKFDWQAIDDLKERLRLTYGHFISNLELDLCDIYDIVGEDRDPYCGRDQPPQFVRGPAPGTLSRDGSRTDARADFWLTIIGRVRHIAVHTLSRAD